MITQVNSDVYSLTMMNIIINYNRYGAVAIPKSDIYIVTNKGQKKMRKTTV